MSDVDEDETFADRLARQSDDAAEAKFGVRPNGTSRCVSGVPAAQPSKPGHPDE